MKELIKTESGVFNTSFKEMQILKLRPMSAHAETLKPLLSAVSQRWDCIPALTAFSVKHVPHRFL